MYERKGLERKINQNIKEKKNESEKNVESVQNKEWNIYIHFMDTLYCFYEPDFFFYSFYPNL